MTYAAMTSMRLGTRMLSKRLTARPRNAPQARSNSSKSSTEPSANPASQPPSAASKTSPTPPSPPGSVPPAASTSTSPPPVPSSGKSTTFFTPTANPSTTFLAVLLAPITLPFRAYVRAQQSSPLKTQLFTSVVIYFLGDLSTQYVMSPCSPVAPPPALPPSTSLSTLSTSPVLHRPKTLPDPEEEDPHTRSSSFVTFLGEHYSGTRSLRAMLIGGLASIPGYKWFLYLGTHFNVPASVYLPARAAFLASLVLKVSINQAIFTPLFNSYFFGMQSLLSFPFRPPFSAARAHDALFAAGEAAHAGWADVTMALQRFWSTANAIAAWERIRDTVPTSWWNSCKFWPAVTAFSFTFVPVQHRNAFAGVLAIGWQTYLGVVNQEAARREVVEGTKGVS